MCSESKPRRLRPFSLVPLALISICAVAAETRAAGVRVCLAEEVKDATVTLLKNGQPTSIKATQERDDKKCYSKNELRFARDSTYGLLIKAPNYKEKTEPLNVSALNAQGYAEPEGSVTLEKETPGGGGGGGGGTSKVVRVCLKGADGKPVINPSVVLLSEDESQRHPLAPEAQGQQCYRSEEITLEDAKGYKLLVKAADYNDAVQPLDQKKVQPGGLVGPTDPVVLTRVGEPPSLRKWLAVAIIAVAVLAALGLLLFWWKRRPREQGKVFVGTRELETARPHVAAKEETPVQVVHSQSAPKQVAAEPPAGAGAHVETLLEQRLTRIVELLEILVGQKQGDEERRRADKAAEDVEIKPPPAFVSNAPELPPDGEQLASTYYANFLRGDDVRPEPIFLSAEGGSSMMDMLGSKPAVLEDNPQGALVLFRTGDGGDSGWVYPNTQLHYREEALRKVFPGFKEEQFKSLKETKSPEGSGVEPVRVRRVDASHWEVASN